jgi:hypothetical protein
LLDFPIPLFPIIKKAMAEMPFSGTTEKYLLKITIKNDKNN